LSDSEKQVLSKLEGINMQNAFKNIMKGFIWFINKIFNKIYVYTYNENDKGQSPQTPVAVKLIEEPTSKKKKMFLQKFKINS